MRIRTVIVDDEPLARSRILKLLRYYDDIKVIGQCRNAREAIACINKKCPELIFLDIQMPDMDAFGVIAKLDLSYQPFIVFATAYDKYALKAFDVHAIDYLLKPFDKERFEAAIDRARAQIKLRKSSDFNRKLMGLLRDYKQEESAFFTSFCIRENGRQLSIPVEEIFFIESDGNYVSLHLTSKAYLYRSTMNALEKSLDPERFLRIHRCYLINTLFVKRVRYLNNSEYEFDLTNGQKLTSSRSYCDKVRDALSQHPLLQQI